MRIMSEIQDKSSIEYQRKSWNALSNRITKLVNHGNESNMYSMIPKLLSVNLIRGKGLFCQACMNLQAASPGSTDIIAALVAIVNSQYFDVGELLVKRVILEFRSAYDSFNKIRQLSAVKFLAHLVNQKVVHSLIVFEVTNLLLTYPTNETVEVAVVFVTECGSTLQDLCSLRLSGIFALFDDIRGDERIDERVQYLIDCLFATWEAKFQGYPAIRPELDVVNQEDHMTHKVFLYEEIDAEMALDVFSPDPNFAQNELVYEELKRLMVSGEYADESDSEDEQDDETEINLINLRSRIYLTIMTSVDSTEAERKLLNMKLEPGQEMELCTTLLECCTEERTYLRYYGLLGQRFCAISRIYKENFEKCFVQQYSMIHQLQTNQVRNVAKFFAHLLCEADALPWHVLACIQLTEKTDCSSLIFIKFLFLELQMHKLLNERLCDPDMQDSLESIFPKDDPNNTRFAIHFFTSIGLGGITGKLQEYLKNMQQQKAVQELDSDSTSSGSECDGSSSDSNESEYELSSFHSQTDGENDRDDELEKITKATRQALLSWKLI